jgi:hypothetical protein
LQINIQLQLYANHTVKTGANGMVLPLSAAGALRLLQRELGIVDETDPTVPIAILPDGDEIAAVVARLATSGRISALRELTLSIGNVEQRAFLDMCAAMETHLVNVETLGITYLGDVGGGGTVGPAIARIIRALPRLTALDLSDNLNGVDGVAVRELCSALRGAAHQPEARQVGAC